MKAREEKPESYQPRAPVKEQFCAWDKTLDGYRPKDYTSDTVRQQSGKAADDMDVCKVKWASRTSFEGVLRFNNEGRPLNPRACNITMQRACAVRALR